MVRNEESEMTSLEFRAWDYDDKKMYKVVRIDFEQVWGEDDAGILICKFNEIAENESTNVRYSTNYELMQYIGRKDEKGNKIFTGDICTSLVGVTGEVILHNGEYVLKNNDGYFRIGKYPPLIKGNIYEKELN